MNITKENIDQLNAVLRVTLGPDDYKGRVDREIKKQQKNARVPGFRPGKVPEGMIRKMYGKAILADELNKILNEGLNNYITENKLEILGNPLPKSEPQDIDFENPSNFEFHYDLGLAPDVNVKLDAQEKFPYYVIKVDEDLLEKYLADIRRKYGKFSNPELSEKNDILYGEFVQLDESGNTMEDGIRNVSTIALELIQDPQEQNKFLGKTKDQEIVFNPSKAVNNLSEIAAMLGITKEQAEQIKSDFQFHIKTINRIEKAELNQDLFDKVYGTGVVTDESGFIEKVKEDIRNIFKVDSDRKLKSDIVDKLLNQTGVKLPDDFLKRWLIAANEKPITQEEIENEYDGYARGLKWRLVENKIIKVQNIQITPDELKEYARELIRSQFAQYGQMNMDEETMDNMVNRYLAKEEQVRKMYENLADKKVFEYLKSVFTLNEKELPYDEFIKTVSAL